MNASAGDRYPSTLNWLGTLPPAEHGRQALKPILQKVERFDDELRLIPDVADQHLDTPVEARPFELELDGEEVTVLDVWLVGHDALHAIEFHAPFPGWARDHIIRRHFVLLLLVASTSQDPGRGRPTARGDRTTSRGRPERRNATSAAIAAEAQDIVRETIGDAAGLTIKAQLRRATANLGYNADAWRIFEALYGRAGSWSPAAIDDLRCRFLTWREREEARNAVERLRGGLGGTSRVGWLQRVERIRARLAALQREVDDLAADLSRQ